MKRLVTDFTDREALIAYVRGLSQQGNQPVSAIRGGAIAADKRLSTLDIPAYSQTRNYLDGAVSRLSPYIRHGVVAPDRLATQLSQTYPAGQRARFVQQLAWREFFHLVHQSAPSLIWQDREAYKTGFAASDYAEDLPKDIAQGQTGVRLIDQLIMQLLNQGYLHNHARLYLAAYVVHWRRVRWQAGARWFLSHLLDGDIASNNYSWQWVASTFSAKPYIFNLENVARFGAGQLDTQHPSNAIFDADYPSLQALLFPHFALQEGA